MIPLWRQIQKKNFHDSRKLAAFLEIDESHFHKNARFVLNLPIRLANKIKKNSLHDPLLLQFLPVKEEDEPSPGFSPIPISETTFLKQNKLLHKYAHRALLLCTSACAMHCRYCFRQNFPYETNVTGFEAELDLIQKDVSLREIILSGGDPLSLSDESLSDLLYKLDKIDHIKRIRFHTRFPIGIPERIDDAFLTILRSIKKQIFFVIHCNHPKELDEDIFSHLKKLQLLGIPVLNQCVLLKQVNDEPAIQFDLCMSLIDQGIIPYYIHQLDRVAGAKRFEVNEEKGLQIMQYLQKNLPGYGVPQYVREVPNEKSKTLLTSGSWSAAQGYATPASICVQ